MQAAGDPVDYRVVGILAGDGPLTGAFGRTVIVPLTTAQAVFAETGVTRVDIGLSPGADRDTVSAALESRLTAQPYVLSSPQDLAAALRASTADFQVDDRADRRDRPVRRRLPDLQHAVDDRLGAHPRSRPVAGRRGAPRTGHVVHAHPGAGPRRRRLGARARPRGAARRRDGRLRPDRRIGHPRAPGAPARRHRLRTDRRDRRDPRGRPRARPPGQPHPAGRGAHPATRSPGGTVRATALARRRLRRRRARRRPGPASRRRRRAGSSRRSSSTPSCSSPRCSSRSSCPPSSGSPVRRSRPSSGSRSGSPAARSSATGAGPR